MRAPTSWPARGRKDSSWSATGKGSCAAWPRAHPLSGHFEDPTARDAAIARELRESKAAIEARTGKPVTHLCYPWHVAGARARREAREIGYRTAFCGKVHGTPISRPGSDPHQIARLGEDYVETLPGRGREDLSIVLQRKWTRRLRGGP